MQVQRASRTLFINTELCYLDKDRKVLLLLVAFPCGYFDPVSIFQMNH